MVVASGYIEGNDHAAVDGIMDELFRRDIDVTGVQNERVVFLIVRENAEDVKRELDALHSIEGARGVFIAYYSLEGADKE